LPGMSEMLQERDIECWIASTLLLVAPYLIWVSDSRFVSAVDSLPIYSLLRPALQHVSLTLGRLRLVNRSLGLNYGVGSVSCFQKNETLSFRPNRIWHEGPYSLLLEFLVSYPPESMPSLYTRFLAMFLGLSPWPLSAN
jgi:hypothetical protein